MYTDGFEFLRYLWRRRAMFAIACASALVITGMVSVLLPVRYTATASVLIEPPGGNDPRAATAVSPVYLESLKTYQHLASSDTLFLRALDDLHLREKYPRAAVESLKRQMLSVDKPTSTSIIEISATLNDARQAQALAEYIAKHTVELNSILDEQSNQDILLEPQRTYEAATARLAQAEQARDRFAQTTSVDPIAKQVAASADLKSDVERDLARARAELADYQARQDAPQLASINESQPGWTQLEIVATRARIKELENQDRQLLQFLAEKEMVVENLTRARQQLDDELSSARAGAELATAKLSDVRASAAFRGVRLKVLDPGIVPQRASFPNVPLNLVVAFVISLLGCVGFAATQFAYDRMRRANADPVYSLR